MLKKSRLYISAILTAVVLASLLVTTNVKACGDEPQTLLMLFMNSDLVVLAKYDGQGEGTKTSEDEYGYSLESLRNLEVSKVFKGQSDLKKAGFVFSEYVSIQPPTNPENVAEVPEHQVTEEYFDASKIKVGEEYIFFLQKNEDTGQYRISDYSSGVLKTDKNLQVYEKSLKELADISADTENRAARLAEWIVKSIEEPTTRTDGISDLSEILYTFNAEKELSVVTENESSDVAEEEKIVSYRDGVGAKLTPTQLSRVSAVLYPMLQEAWFAPEPIYAEYGIGSVLASINKARLATYAYSALQSVGKDDLERRYVIMEFLSSNIGDQNLSDIYYEYLELENKIKETKELDTPEAKKELKVMLASKNTMLKNFDKRFKFMLERNFVKAEEPQA